MMVKSILNVILMILLIQKSKAEIISLTEDSINNQCSFQFNYDSSQKQIIFVSCSPFNLNSSSAIQGPVIQWSICQKLCCTMKNAPTETNVRSCLASQTSINLYYMTKSIIIVFICLFVLCALVIIGYKLRNLSIFKSKEEIRLINQAQQLDLTRAINSIKWLSRKTKYINQTCSQEQHDVSDGYAQSMQHLNICKLCSNSKTQLESHCGHHYHVECLQYWLNDHQKCPQCPTVIHYLRVNCLCQNFYFVMKMPLFRSQGNFIVKCPRCTERQEIQLKITHKFWLQQGKIDDQVCIQSRPSYNELIIP